VTEEPPERTGSEEGERDPGTPGREAEEVPGTGSPQSQEELRARLEEQLRRLRVQDLMIESVVSVLNLTARRIAKEDERDLEQARVGIDAIRAWVDFLPDEAATQIRNALSELQVLYAQAVEGGGTEGPPESEVGGQGPGAPGGEAEEAPGSGAPPRPASEPPPRLWTPPGTN
jgi:hypothetical protein